MNDRLLRSPSAAAPAVSRPPVHPELELLDARINALLPPQYQSCYNTVPPVSMGSAGLKYGPDGRVAWDEIWTSFCDLAVAGGPPHRGTLLEPVTADVARSDDGAYRKVVEEIGRGIWLVTQLPVLPRRAPGWVGVVCQTEAMAGWMLRAVVAENLSARREGNVLLLPAGPHFQLAKEIKNVITVMAKTCHYWLCHMDAERQTAADQRDPVGPALPEEVAIHTVAYRAAQAEIEAGIRAATDLAIEPERYAGWLGLRCADVRQAVWLLRAVLVSGVLARREENLLYVPVNTTRADGPARRVAVAVTDAHRLYLLHVQSQVASG